AEVLFGVGVVPTVEGGEVGAGPEGEIRWGHRRGGDEAERLDLQAAVEQELSAEADVGAGLLRRCQQDHARAEQVDESHVYLPIGPKLYPIARSMLYRGHSMGTVIGRRRRHPWADVCAGANRAPR